MVVGGVCDMEEREGGFRRSCEFATHGEYGCKAVGNIGVLEKPEVGTPSNSPMRLLCLNFIQ